MVSYLAHSCGVNLGGWEDGAVLLLVLGLLLRIEYALPLCVAPATGSEQNLRHLR